MSSTYAFSAWRLSDRDKLSPPPPPPALLDILREVLQLRPLLDDLIGQLVHARDLQVLVRLQGKASGGLRIQLVEHVIGINPTWTDRSCLIEVEVAEAALPVIARNGVAALLAGIVKLAVLVWVSVHGEGLGNPLEEVHYFYVIQGGVDGWKGEKGKGGGRRKTQGH